MLQPPPEAAQKLPALPHPVFTQHQPVHQHQKAIVHPSLACIPPAPVMLSQLVPSAQS